MSTEFNETLYRELKKLQRKIIRKSGGISEKYIREFEKEQKDKWEDMFVDEANAEMQTALDRAKTGISPFKQGKPRGSMPGLADDPDTPPAPPPRRGRGRRKHSVPLTEPGNKTESDYYPALKYIGSQRPRSPTDKEYAAQIAAGTFKAPKSPQAVFRHNQAFADRRITGDVSPQTHASYAFAKKAAGEEKTPGDLPGFRRPRGPPLSELRKYQRGHPNIEDSSITMTHAERSSIEGSPFKGTLKGISLGPWTPTGKKHAQGKKRGSPVSPAKLPFEEGPVTTPSDVHRMLETHGEDLTVVQGDIKALKKHQAQLTPLPSSPKTQAANLSPIGRQTKEPEPIKQPSILLSETPLVSMEQTTLEPTQQFTPISEDLPPLLEASPTQTLSDTLQTTTVFPLPQEDTLEDTKVFPQSPTPSQEETDIFTPSATRLQDVRVKQSLERPQPREPPPRPKTPEHRKQQLEFEFHSPKSETKEDEPRDLTPVAHKPETGGNRSAGLTDYSSSSAIHADEAWMTGRRLGSGGEEPGQKQKWGSARDEGSEPQKKSGDSAGRGDKHEERPSDGGHGDDSGTTSSTQSGGGRGGGRESGGRRRGAGKKRGGIRRRLKAQDAALENLRLTFEQSQPPPQIIHTQQPAIIPVLPRLLRSQVGVTEKPGIQIKVTTKSQAIINEKTKRKKNKRKVYNKLRKQTLKAIRSGKNAHYKIESAKLKSLPLKTRKVARAKLKQQLRDRELRLVGQLPSASKMAIKDIDRVMRIAQKLKW